MNKFRGLILVVLGLFYTTYAPAQQVVPPVGNTGLACAYNTALPTLPNLAAGWVQCNSNGSLLTAPAVTGSTTTPAAASAVTFPDELAVSGSVSSAAVLFSQDMSGYNSITVEITANASGNTITFETSDDNINWIATYGLQTNIITNIALNNLTNNTNVGVTFKFGKSGRYFRARVSTYIGGTTTVVGNLHYATNIPVIGLVGLPSSTSAIGKVGPGFTSSQTQIQGNSTGTTGAVVGTLAGAAAKTTWICDFDISAIGGTAAVGPIVVAGLLGGSKTYQLSSSASGVVLSKQFTPCLQASTFNTAITITTTADGTATAVDVNSTGYQE